MTSKERYFARLATADAMEARDTHSRLLMAERMRRFAKFVRQHAKNQPAKVQWWLSRMTEGTMYSQTVWGPGQIIWTPRIMRRQAAYVIKYAQQCTSCLPDTGFQEAA
jgi:hypothetical protein